MAKLIVIKGPDMGQTFDLLSSTQLGREKGSDVRLSDERIAERHLRIVRDKDAFRVEVLGSVRPIKINGAVVELLGPRLNWGTFL